MGHRLGDLYVHTPGRNEGYIYTVLWFKDVVWVTVNGFPIYSSTGDCSEIVISFVDISARKLAENELNSHRDLLEEMIEVRTNELIERNKSKHYDNDFLNKVRNIVL